MRTCLMGGALPALVLVLASCQMRSFVFQPDAEHAGVHLNFAVQTPSKADILFVIDNSGSMSNKQKLLGLAINHMLAGLAPQKTSYRIGIVSTDAYGSLKDCQGSDNPQVGGNTMTDAQMGAKGNCGRPEVLLQRPHDGTLGRLIAAYDPQAFAAANFASLSPAAQAAVAQLSPTQSGGVVTWPIGANGVGGPRHVIDRDTIAVDACKACGCGSCEAGAQNACLADCASPATEALVQAYFRSNISGLGQSGFGWEEGLLAALWAVGIDPQQTDDATALNPSYNLVANTQPNTFVTLDPNGVLQQGSWLRDDALLGVVIVSDEQDCSMPTGLMSLRAGYERDAPASSICYQPSAQRAFLDTRRMANLLVTKKTMATQVAVGFIGGVQKTGTSAGGSLFGSPADCALTAARQGSAVPNSSCTCLAAQDAALTPDARWCQFTQVPSVPGSLANPYASWPACAALSGSRYVAFANAFARRTFESICRNDTQDDGTVIGFGPALRDFARIATLPCFDLEGLMPLGADANNLVVKRAPSGSSAPLEELPLTGGHSDALGWYYNAQDNQVCLTGLPRIIGDRYDIFVYTISKLDYQR